MMTVAEAERIILDLIQPFDGDRHSETIPLTSAHQRILSQTVTSPLDVPHWDNSAMDGYAVCFADFEAFNPEKPPILEIIEEIPAGVVPQKTVQRGQCARIFTGAMMPQGADSVVMQENTRLGDRRVEILTPPKYQEFVRPKGDYYKAGNPLLSPGIVLKAAELAVLAAGQCSQISVYRRPVVAIFSTGDELVSGDRPLQVGQIVDSNRYALGAFVEQMGAVPLYLGIVPDDRDRLRATMQAAIQQADLVLSTGGVSVGDYDYVEALLAELGGEIVISAVAIKPGKPLTVAKFPENKLYFGIPGNPVSALVSCWRFVQPALSKLSGVNGPWTLPWRWATTTQVLKGTGTRETYLWGRLQTTETGDEFHLAGGSHSSANLINLAQTNALAVIPAGVSQMNPGDRLRILPIP